MTATMPNVLRDVGVVIEGDRYIAALSQLEKAADACSGLNVQLRGCEPEVAREFRLQMAGAAIERALELLRQR